MLPITQRVVRMVAFVGLMAALATGCKPAVPTAPAARPAAQPVPTQGPVAGAPTTGAVAPSRAATDTRAAHRGHGTDARVVAGEFSQAVGAPRDEFLYAASTNDLATVKKMLGEGRDINATGEFDYTALHMAARNGHIEMAQLLVTQGADIDARNKSGMTPLHWAARTGQLSVVQYLVSQGAEINALGDVPDPTDVTQITQVTPIDIAASNSHYEVVDWLKENGAQ